MADATGLSAVLEAAPWIDTLGLSLLHFLWQGVVIGALFYLVRAMLPVTRSEARYAIGLGALALLAACPVITFLVVRPPAGAAQTMANVDALAQPLATFASAVSSADPAWQASLPYLVLVWCAGVLFMAWRAFRDWRGLERVARHMAERNVEIERTLARLAQRLKVVQRVRVLVSAHIDTPSLIGWLRPVILLPAAVVIGLPRHQLELILSHELGHLRRCDHLVNLAQAVVETLLFYHPVVHWISRDVRHEREVCCDRLVLRASNDEPREYARALAALEEFRQVPAQIALAATGGMLVDRVRRIVGVPAPRMAATRSTTGVWLLGAAGMAAIALSLQLRQIESDPLSATGAAPTLNVVSSAVPDAVGLAGLVLRLPALQTELLAPAASAIRVAPLRDIPAPAKAFIAPARVALPLLAPAQKVANVLDPGVAMNPAPLQAPDLIAAPSVAPPPRFEVASVAPVAASAQRDEPVATRKVAPQYPAGAVRGSEVRVELAFGIDANGRVRNLRVLDGRSDRAFAEAATDALRAWRFDPSSVSTDPSLRYRQTFVFAGEHTAAGLDPEGCTTRTGSRICL